LHDRGVKVCGVDLSPEMIANARRLSPEIEFRQGDMLGLDAPNDAYAGIAAFYSIIHVAREDLERAFCEMKRALRPGGLLLLAFHLGEETIHLDAWWEKPVCVDFFLFRAEEVTQYLRAAGFEIEEVLEREPYLEVEHQSRRAYIFARRPVGPAT
jgi:SAM-dependent methyltransferase